MRPVTGIRCVATTVPLTLVGSLVASAVMAAPPGGADPSKPLDGKTGKPVVLEARFADGSTLKLSLHDDHLGLDTPHGPLLFPVGDIHKIEFGLRISDEVAKRIEAAIGKLGSSQFREREDASAELFALKEKAYSALLKAAKHTDPEVARRADEIIGKLKGTVPAEILDLPPHDFVYTEHSKIAGRITVTSVKVSTAQFGELQLKLGEVRSLRNLVAKFPEPEPKDVLPDPGSMDKFAGQVGQVFRFRVTGAAQGSLWGTGQYTTDSTLAMAAAHAGVLKVGETGIVKVTIVPPPPNFQGSAQNGVTSSPWGPYPSAFQVTK